MQSYEEFLEKTSLFIGILTFLCARATELQKNSRIFAA
jgi:hypothetical protein